MEHVLAGIDAARWLDRKGALTSVSWAPQAAPAMYAKKGNISHNEKMQALIRESISQERLVSPAPENANLGS